MKSACFRAISSVVERLLHTAIWLICSRLPNFSQASK